MQGSLQAAHLHDRLQPEEHGGRPTRVEPRAGRGSLHAQPTHAPFLRRTSTRSPSSPASPPSPPPPPRRTSAPSRPTPTGCRPRSTRRARGSRPRATASPTRRRGSRRSRAASTRARPTSSAPVTTSSARASGSRAPEARGGNDPTSSPTTSWPPTRRAAGPRHRRLLLDRLRRPLPAARVPQALGGEQRAPARRHAQGARRRRRRDAPARAAPDQVQRAGPRRDRRPQPRRRDRATRCSTARPRSSPRLNSSSSRLATVKANIRTIQRRQAAAARALRAAAVVGHDGAPAAAERRHVRRDRARHRGGEPDRHHPVRLGRRARRRERRLRLLRLGQLRAGGRRPPRHPARLDRLHELGRARARRAHHRLRERRPRLHGRRRAPL